MKQERLEVVFTGHVQGVGFRMTAFECAHRQGVVGWVRNEPDGSVRLVAEGGGDAIRGLLDCIEEKLPGHIHHMDEVRGAGTGEFDSFRILTS